jgi:Amt family ammonium transporter
MRGERVWGWRLWLSVVLGLTLVVQPSCWAQQGPEPARTDPTRDTTAPFANSRDVVIDGSVDTRPATPESLAHEVERLRVGLNLLGVLIAGFLVLFMQAGFALVECGLTRAKNAAHTMAMNVVVLAVAVLGYWIAGFAFQMGGVGSTASPDASEIAGTMVRVPLFGQPIEVLGWGGFFLSGLESQPSVLALFLFQTGLMVTAATIPTGTLAERWKFSAFLIYSVVMSVLIYPVYACWVWGGGWLADLGRDYGLGNGHVDVAGSSVVHLTGGLAALAGALVVGPRIGKFTRVGAPNAIPGHNIPMVMLGTLVLAFGWFGFNLGHTLAVSDGRLAAIAVSTLLALSAGCVSSLIGMWLLFGKPDPTMSCNGLLGGAVAISASCAFVTPVGAVVIGGLAGLLVIGSVLFLERVLKVDDPVGAISVHGACGAWGCLSVGLFANGSYGTGWNGVNGQAPLGLFHGGGTSQVAAEFIGLLANALWVFPTAWLGFTLVNLTLGSRVTAQVEVAGLDIPEMGVAGYVLEETMANQAAGLEYLDTYGPGVPRRGSSGLSGGDRPIPIKKS